jgi:hypothetical protein
LVFLVLTVLLSYQGTNAVALLGLLVLVALVGGIYTVVKIPQTLVRSLLVLGLGRPCRIWVSGMGNIPERGPVLLLGNSIGYLDWACVQIASPRPVRFFVQADELPRWYPGWLRNFLGIEVLDPAASPVQLRASISGWLDKGAAVCLLSRLPEPMPDGIHTPVVPFCLYSANASITTSGYQAGHGLGRRVAVCLGDELPSYTTYNEVLSRIEQLSRDCTGAE